MSESKTRIWLSAAACAALVASLGCDDPAERQARAEAKARAQAEAEERRVAEAHEVEQTEQAERDKQAKAREEEARQAEQARGALGACCTALARRGFEQRNMNDMAAKRLCIEAESKGDSLAAVRPALLQGLSGRELPPGCLAN